MSDVIGVLIDSFFIAQRERFVLTDEASDFEKRPDGSRLAGYCHGRAIGGIGLPGLHRFDHRNPPPLWVRRLNTKLI